MVVRARKSWLRHASAHALLIGLAVLTPAMAQELAEEAADAESDEEVVVTGSRIARPDVTANVPIAVIGEDAIARSGVANIQDLINDLPQLGIASTRSNSNFSASGNGISTLSLRNLGPNRTLTLVNGRRVVAGTAGSSAVDVNNIAPDLIKRIEIITGGASAVYGSGAIAGVVNFILKDEFEGLQLNFQTGLSEYGDARHHVGSITGGTSWGNDDRGHALFSFNYEKDEGLRSRDRWISAEDRFLATRGPAAYSSFAPQGRFDLRTAAGTSAGIFTFDLNNNVVSGFPVGFGYNRNNDSGLSVPLERYLANFNLGYEISDRIDAFVETTYAKTQSRNWWSPYSIDSFQAYRNLTDGIPITNAFIPASIQAQIAAANSDANPSNDIVALTFRSRAVDIYSRENTGDRETWRIAAGFEGSFGSGWSWDASYVYGKLDDVTFADDINYLNFQRALDAIVDPGSGNIICRSADARADGCVPINMFGYGNIDPAAAAYVTRDSERWNHVINEQHVVAANVSGSVGGLAAGDISLAFGAEYRYESGSSDWDERTNLGLNSSSQQPDISGSYDVLEFYAEADVPLLAQQPWAHYLGLTGAIRFSDYSTVGQVLAWNAGIEYAPVKDLRFRSVYASANRAPTISELFAPQGFANISGLTDPCNGVTATSTRELDNACRAIPSIAQAIATFGALTYEIPFDYNTIGGYSGGNVNLNEETADTLTIGAVYTPSSLKGFSVSVDYFKIDIADAIGVIPPQLSITQCLRTGDPAFCNNVRRYSSGKLDEIDTLLSNIASIETSGIDLNVRYATGLGLLDDDWIDVSLLYTYLISLEQVSYPGADVDDNVGELFAAGRLGSGYEHKATLNVAYSFDAWTFNWRLNYQGEIQSTLDAVYTGADADILNDWNHVPAYIYNDVQLRWAGGPDRNVEIYFGIDNLFDEDPPIIPSGFAATVSGTETAAGNYDVVGRRYYLGVTTRF